jgi:hypothetical protein
VARAGDRDELRLWKMTHFGALVGERRVVVLGGDDQRGSLQRVQAIERTPADQRADCRQIGAPLVRAEHIDDALAFWVPDRPCGNSRRGDQPRGAAQADRAHQRTCACASNHLRQVSVR